MATKPEPKSLLHPGDLGPLRRQYPILAHMAERGMPLDRENYIAMAYGPSSEHPDPWTDEHEAELPPPFRRPGLHDEV